MPSSHAKGCNLLRFVLDTNIVLDWLVFADANCAELAVAVERRKIELLVCKQTLAEFDRVLGYPQLRVGAERQIALQCSYAAAVTTVEWAQNSAAAPFGLPAHFPLCRDPDDQIFFALAFHAQADGLVSHDKSVLKLKRRVGKFGVRVYSLAELNRLLCDDSRSVS